MPHLKPSLLDWNLRASQQRPCGRSQGMAVNPPPLGVVLGDAGAFEVSRKGPRRRLGLKHTVGRFGNCWLESLQYRNHILMQGDAIIALGLADAGRYKHGAFLKLNAAPSDQPQLAHAKAGEGSNEIEVAPGARRRHQATKLIRRECATFHPNVLGLVEFGQVDARVDRQPRCSDRPVQERDDDGTNAVDRSRADGPLDLVGRAKLLDGAKAQRPQVTLDAVGVEVGQSLCADIGNRPLELALDGLNMPGVAAPMSKIGKVLGNMLADGEVAVFGHAVETDVDDSLAAQHHIGFEFVRECLRASLVGGSRASLAPNAEGIKPLDLPVFAAPFSLENRSHASFLCRCGVPLNASGAGFQARF